MANADTTPHEPLPPGSTLGVFGGGQLGRMFCEAASALGFKTHVFAPEGDCPASQAADAHTVADYHDFAAVAGFAESVDAVTLEFENVPVATAEAAARHTRVAPSGEALFMVQNRGREKRFLLGAGVPCAPFAMVRNNDELLAAVDLIGAPSVLKTTQFGYDGKGQVVLHDAAEAADAWAYLGRHKCVLEQFVEFRREVSVVVARGMDGATAVCGPIENDHKNHILDLSLLPAACDESVAAEARRVAELVAKELDLVGVVCVEFFETTDGQVVVNEIAPRPHNSGHLTIEACAASQFEQQARAIAGMPLGSFEAPRPAAMANLLGDLWSAGEPDWDAAKAVDGVQLHLYGKGSARPGRKMGHLTAVADTVEAARDAVLEARRRLGPS
ncbi:N5-carboxyaminoimidazole ribonucleotide synthase [Pseudobythopirellula maris]|uniref:N5-carboxyaminoimidazole ribonucleotide synthase n=1 Tax=Pseudobythopirellula maris TaxID=2527991 RepID=A0A5C5ZM75_9BACT|nr:5-(carboxyamino)imidazole ribonucleotide synthase [Pseudobythopirellula maris]TWT88499.1 N5-carboxyaminoimidazole ribonucleotide synthase [Pseudobythopirellula maris]